MVNYNLSSSGENFTDIITDLSNKCKAGFSLHAFSDLFDNDNNCLRHSVPYTVFLFVMFCFVWLVGFMGNLAIIILVCRHQRLRKVTNLLIVNLAVADLLVPGFCIPVYLIGNMFIPWVLSGAMCKAASFVQPVCRFATVYSLLAVGVERCRAICRPLCQRRGFSRTHTAIIILLIWTFALATSSPMPFVYHVTSTRFDPLPRYCQEHWDNKHYENVYYLLFDMIITFIFPLVTIAVLTIFILKSIRERQVPSPQQQHIGLHVNILVVRQQTGTNRLQIVRMLTGMTLFYFVCWLPFYTIRFIEFWADNKGDMGLSQILMPIVTLLGYANSSANPYLYTMLNDTFYESIFAENNYNQNNRFARVARRERARECDYDYDVDLDSDEWNGGGREGAEMIDMAPRAIPAPWEEQ